MTDEEYMRAAIELAERGVGFVNPNPLVGAIIVKNDRIIGEGYHERYGEPHAERNALAKCTESPNDAVMYVTLEPCCHFGKTPPCTEAVVESGIKKVVAGCLDPNPQVAGKGMETLKAAGIEVAYGILEAECKKRNEVFFHYIKTKTPYVTMKYAMTADGKTATATGESRWITGEKAREKVHRDRHRNMGIMAGIGTVLADDPMLTCRIEGCKNPIRIICDSRLRIPLDSNIVNTAKDVRTIVATSSEDMAAHRTLGKAGCEIVRVPEKGGRIDLAALMGILGEKGIDSILLEGGGEMNFSALRSGIVNKVQTYVAPKIFGGRGAKTPVAGEGLGDISSCVKLKNLTVTLLGEDVLLESEVACTCSQGS